MQFIVGATHQYTRKLNSGCVWNRAVSCLPTYEGGEVGLAMQYTIRQSKIALKQTLTLKLGVTLVLTVRNSGYMHVLWDECEYSCYGINSGQYSSLFDN